MKFRKAPSVLTASAALILVGLMWTAPTPQEVAADPTTTTTLFSTANGFVEGEGGEYDQPWWDALVASSPPSYGADPVQFDTGTNMDVAREDLARGTADFAVA